MEKLSDADIKKRLAGLSSWSLGGDRLTKEFTFKDFSEAMDFINQVAAEAEALNHHPEWSNSYNKVSISLKTHSVGGLTANDFELAEAIDAHANSGMR